MSMHILFGRTARLENVLMFVYVRVKQNYAVCGNNSIIWKVYQVEEQFRVLKQDHSHQLPPFAHKKGSKLRNIDKILKK